MTLGLLLPTVISCSAPPTIQDFGAASAVPRLQVTRRSAALRTLPGAPKGRTWIYQLSMPFQVAKGRRRCSGGFEKGRPKEPILRLG